MIKNSAAAACTKWLLAFALAGVGACGRTDAAAGRYQGVLELDERDLAFEVTGRLVEVLVDEGARVRPGQVLARIDPALARAAVAAREAEVGAAREQLGLLRAGVRLEDRRMLAARLDVARAGEALAQQTVTRARQLFASGAMTRAALDEAEAQANRTTAERASAEQSLRAAERGARAQEIEAAAQRVLGAEAALAAERERLARHELRADREGEVLDVNLEPGELAPAGVPVLTIADVGRPYADVFVPQAELSGLRAGVSAWARTDATHDDVPGHIELVHRRTEFTPRYLFSQAERANLVVRVRVRFDDRVRALPAGVPMFVRFDRGTIATATDGGVAP